MTLLKKLSLKLRKNAGWLFFHQHYPNSYLYSLKRDYAERSVADGGLEYRQLSEEAEMKKPGKLIQVKPHAKGANFLFEAAELNVCFLASDFVQVNWVPGKLPIPYAISRTDWPEVKTTLDKKTDNSWTISCSECSSNCSNTIEVIVSVDGSLKFCDSTGQTLREEMPPQRQGNRWIHQAQLRTEEHIYGLGERAFLPNLRSPLDENQSPVAYRIWNFNMGGLYNPGTDPLYICIPVYLGLHASGSYLIFYENTYDATFTFAESATADFEDGALRYYLAIGSPAQLLERYTELTGRSPLPPRWSLGYHQSRWGFRSNAKKILNVIEGYKSHNLPLSAIHLDIDAQFAYRVFTIHPKRFPNFEHLTKELAADGVRCMAITSPGIKYSHKSDLFLQGKLLDAFCKYPNGKPIVAPFWAGWSVFPDFTNPKVRHWWGRQYEYLLDMGIAGFWHDINEPATLSVWGDPTFPKVTQHFLEGRGGDHREAHNVYGLQQVRAAYEAMRRYRPQQRPFIISRSGWAGLQRYSWTWTGDTASSWAMLRQSISTVVGLGLSGIPYSGPDIGGFQGNPSPELFLRWFQMTCFLPFFRNHCTHNAELRLPWIYGEPYLSIIRQFLQLRYRLLPYLYTLAWEAAQKGYPLVRPLFWLDRDDSALWDVDDAFFLGDALLVCPIVEEGARSRSAILPKGYWYNFWDDRVMEGGKEVQFDALIEQIPLLVRAGSILPMEEQEQLILHLYPLLEGTSEGYLYSDAGDGYGEWRVEQFRMVSSPDGLELTWEQHGEYPFSYKSIQLHVHGIKPQQAWVDEEKVAIQGQLLNCQPFKQVRFQV